jgi:hypothetical protein
MDGVVQLAGFAVMILDIGKSTMLISEAPLFLNPLKVAGTEGHTTCRDTPRRRSIFWGEGSVIPVDR